MRGWIRLSLVCMVVIITAYGFAAGGPAVQKHVVWVIPYDYTGGISVAKGDVIELWSAPLPMTFRNLEAAFRAAKAGQGVELIGSTLPHQEGTKTRLFFFKAFEAGPAKLKVELLNKDQSVRQTWIYKVEVK